MQTEDCGRAVWPLLLPQLPYCAEQDSQQGPLPREVHGDTSQESSGAGHLHQGLGGGLKDGKDCHSQGCHHLLRLVPQGRSECPSVLGCPLWVSVYTSVGCLHHPASHFCPLDSYPMCLGRSRIFSVPLFVLGFLRFRSSLFSSWVWFFVGAVFSFSVP